MRCGLSQVASVTQHHVFSTSTLWRVAGGSAVKKPPAVAGVRERQVPSLGREDPLEEEVATHSSILAWRMLWTGEAGRLQSMGSQRVGHD